MTSSLGLFKTICLILTFGMSISACSKSTSWKEEVLLHDGSKIIVDRSVEYGGRHELGQSPPFKEQTLTFTMPKTKQRITWKDDYSDDVGSANFNPLLLEVFRGDTAYVIASPVNIQSISKWDCPDPPYVIFSYHGNAWIRIPIDKLPGEVKTPNLMLSSPDEVARKFNFGLIPASTIKEENEELTQPEFRVIERTHSAQGKVGCLVRNKGGGWGSPGGAKAPGGPFTPHINDVNSKN